MFGPHWSRHRESGSPCRESVQFVLLLYSVSVLSEEEAEEGRELPVVVVSPLSGWGVALGDRKRKACNETWALSGVCCRRFTRASQVSPQQKGTLDTSSPPTRARCTTWTTQVITQPAVSTPFEESQFLSFFFLPLCLPSISESVPTSLLFYIVSASLARIHSVSLSLSHVLSTLCAQPVSHSVWKENSKLSAQQRGRIRHFFLNQGICSCYGKRCFMILSFSVGLLPLICVKRCLVKTWKVLFILIYLTCIGRCFSTKMRKCVNTIPML